MRPKAASRTEKRKPYALTVARHEGPASPLSSHSRSLGLRLRAHKDRPLTRSFLSQAGTHQRPGHHMAPLADAALQGPQLSLGESAGIVPMQVIHQGLGGRVGI